MSDDWQCGSHTPDGGLRCKKSLGHGGRHEAWPSVTDPTWVPPQWDDPPAPAPLPPGDDEPCPECDGVGMREFYSVECEHCSGTGSAPAAAPVLPPGVTLCTAADGTEYLTALGRDVPEGWRAFPTVTRITYYPYIVRPPEPPAEPRTERVPWWQAGDRPVYVKGECFGSISEAASNGCVPPIDLDGTVEVLAEPTDGD